MTEFEKVEKLREKADVSYAEAKEALDLASGDLLDAMIYLEKQGKAKAPQGGGFFSGAGASGGGSRSPHGGGKGKNKGTGGFSDIMSKFGTACAGLLRKGTVNYLDATKDGRAIFSCPVLVLAALLLFFFWITLPLIVVSLFFGIRYRFSGPDLGRDDVNKVMDTTSDMVNEVKKSFRDGANNEGDGGGE